MALEMIIRFRPAPPLLPFPPWPRRAAVAARGLKADPAAFRAFAGMFAAAGEAVVNACDCAAGTPARADGAVPAAEEWNLSQKRSPAPRTPDKSNIAARSWPRARRPSADLAGRRTRGVSGRPSTPHL